MTREQKYKAELREMGIYREAFDPEIHMLAMMERELQRMVKDWKACGSEVGTELHDAIVRQRRDILSHRDALGLTPKGAYRLTGKNAAAETGQEARASVLEMVRTRRQGSA